MRRALVVMMLLSLGGCEGVITGPLGLNLPNPGTPTTPDEPPPIVTACTDSPTPGTAPLRRLSHEEYQNALVDLFGNATLAQQVTQDFVQDPVSLGFRNSARFLDVKLVMAQAYLKAAETVAAEQLRALTTWLPCASTGGEPCAQQVIDGKLKRLYRRPLTAGEKSTYLTLFRTGSMGASFATGIEWMLVTALQSPHFLYRPEVEGDLNARTLTPHELALLQPPHAAQGKWRGRRVTVAAVAPVPLGARRVDDAAETGDHRVHRERRSNLAALHHEV